MASGAAGLPQWMAPCWLWENLWGLQWYRVKKPGRNANFDLGIADRGLKILNPTKRAPWDFVVTVGNRLMFLTDKRIISLLTDKRIISE
jgi:hypothetical protein